MAIDPALRDTIAKRFPGALAYLNAPELISLLEKAVAEEWTPETFQSQIMATPWYQKKTDAERAWFVTESGNPGEATARVNARKQDIQKLLFQLGAPQMSNEELGAHAWQSLREGWTESDLRYNVASLAQPAGTSVGSTDIRALAKDYMVDLTDDKVTDLSRRVFAGQLDENGLRAMFAKQASGAYPALADIIAQGHTPNDYFDPYRQLIAKNTDTPPMQIDLNSATWRKIVSYAAPDGKLRPMTIDEANQYVRSTDEFANSSTGQRELASYQTEMEKMFGMRR